MGIFDPVRTLNPDDPIDTVGQYQRAMNRATYSPAVAQAAARSGVNPTMATRIASREVASQAAQALPGLIQNDVQMMEARRQENERKERERLALMLNTGGQVLGTALNAFDMASGAEQGQGVGDSMGLLTDSLKQYNPNNTAASVGSGAGAQAYLSGILSQSQAGQALSPTAPNATTPSPTGIQELMDQPIYSTPAQTPGAPVVSSGLLAAQPVQSPVANQYLQDSASAEITPPNTGRRIRRRRR